MSRPLCLLVRPVAGEAMELLRARVELRVLDGGSDRPIATPEEVIAAIRDAEILYALPANPCPRAVLEAAPKLRMIATMGTGYENIDIAAARERGIPVTYAPGILDETTADAAFALLLATARRLPEAERFLRAGKWQGWAPGQFLGQDVHHKTLGIVGMGRIGRQVARRAKCFAMTLIYTDVRPNPDAERDLGVRYVTMDELLRSADFVTLHVPLMPETRHLIDAAALRKMKRTAVLINTARGPVVDEDALARALREGWIAGAGLDVHEQEPKVNAKLLELENVVLLPHIASASEETRRRMALRAVENIFAFLDSKPLLDPVP